jgi:hypothetical protein
MSTKDAARLEDLARHGLEIVAGEPEPGVQVCDRGADVLELGWHLGADLPRGLHQSLEVVARGTRSDPDRVLDLVEGLTDRVQGTRRGRRAGADRRHARERRESELAARRAPRSFGGLLGAAEHSRPEAGHVGKYREPDGGVLGHGRPPPL